LLSVIGASKDGTLPLIISTFSIKIIIGTSWILILVIEFKQHYGITPFLLMAKETVCQRKPSPK